MREQECIQNCGWKPARHTDTLKFDDPILNTILKRSIQKQTMRMSRELYCLRIQITAFVLWRLIFRFGKIQNFAVEWP